MKVLLLILLLLPATVGAQHKGDKVDKFDRLFGLTPDDWDWSGDSSKTIIYWGRVPIAKIVYRDFSVTLVVYDSLKYKNFRKLVAYKKEHYLEKYQMTQ